MEDSTLEMIVYLAAGFAIGSVICFSALRQRYLAKYKKSVLELKAKYAGDVSQALLISKRLLEAEEQNEVLVGEVEKKHSTIETLENQIKESAEKFARLERDLSAAQALVNEQGDELKNYQSRLRLNRNDLEYTANLEARLATLVNDFELRLSHKEIELKNLQYRLDDVEQTKRLLIEEMKRQRRSANDESAARFAQPEIQELQNMVHDLIADHPSLDEPGTKALVETALAEAEAAHQQLLREKDVEIAQLLEYLSGVENLQARAAKRNAGLPERETRLVELQADYQRLASEKAAREAELAQWIQRANQLEDLQAQLTREYDNKLQALVEAQRTELADKDTQIADLLERVGFVGTLRKQYAEKEAELQALDERFQTVVNNKTLEIHFLQERLETLEKLHATSIEELKTGLASQLAESDFESRELPAVGVQESRQPGELGRSTPNSIEQYQAALNAKDEEIADLQERIDALETLFAAHSEEVDLKLKEKEAEIEKSREDAEALEVFVAAHSQEIDARLQEKEAEILELQACIAELEAADFISQELKKMEAEYQATIQTKNSEIVRLQMRVNQLEPFSALVAQRDARIRELDSRYQIALGAKEAEIARLQNRLKELKGTVKMAC